jgi:hypothetical protein
MDTKATKGIFTNVAQQNPPYTREKYLEYFRSIAYGESSLMKHGGNRRVDIQMARELSKVYARQSRGHRQQKNSIVEDDVRASTHLTPLAYARDFRPTVHARPPEAQRGAVVGGSSL